MTPERADELAKHNQNLEMSIINVAAMANIVVMLMESYEDELRETPAYSGAQLVDRTKQWLEAVSWGVNHVNDTRAVNPVNTSTLA